MVPRGMTAQHSCKGALFKCPAPHARASHHADGVTPPISFWGIDPRTVHACRAWAQVGGVSVLQASSTEAHLRATYLTALAQRGRLLHVLSYALHTNQGFM